MAEAEAIKVEVGGFRCRYETTRVGRWLLEFVSIRDPSNGQWLYVETALPGTRRDFPPAVVWLRRADQEMRGFPLDRFGTCTAPWGSGIPGEYAWLLDLANEAAILATGRPLIPED